MATTSETVTVWSRNPADRQQLTPCCGCYSTYCDNCLVCKKCFRDVAPGQGDGSSFLPGSWVVERSYALHYVLLAFDLPEESGQTLLSKGREFAWFPRGTDPNQEPTK